MIVFHTGTPEEAERELAPFKEWGSPIVVQVGPMPYPVMNTILDDGLPDGLAQLLALELHERPVGRADRHRGASAFATVPSTMTDDPVRALPRRRHARRRQRHGRAAPRGGLEPRAPGGLDGPRRDRDEHRLDADTHAAVRRAPRPSAAGSTTSPTTRATTRSATPTGRTTTGSSRSSAGTTRATSSGRTTTSSRSRRSTPPRGSRGGRARTGFGVAGDATS